MTVGALSGFEYVAILAGECETRRAMLMARSIASASLLFTGLTRLPMAAEWDHLLPAWFTRLHPRWRPVNSILFVAILVIALTLLSMLGVREQEANQVLANASIVHYAIAYVALFALPFLGSRSLREKLPGWLKVAAMAGFASSLVAVLISVYPIVDVVSLGGYGAKIGGTVILSNLIGVVIYRVGSINSGTRLL